MKLCTLVLVTVNLVGLYSTSFAVHLFEEDLRLACRLAEQLGLDETIRNLLGIFRERYPNEKLDDSKLSQTLGLILAGSSEGRDKSRPRAGATVSTSSSGGGPTTIVNSNAAANCNAYANTADLLIAIAQGLTSSTSTMPGLGISTGGSSSSGYLVKRGFPQTIVTTESSCSNFALPNPVNLDNFEDLKTLIGRIWIHRANELTKIYEMEKIENEKIKLLSIQQLIAGQAVSDNFNEKDNIASSKKTLLLKRDDFEFVCESYRKNYNATAALNSLILRLESYSHPGENIQANIGALALIVQDALIGSSSRAFPLTSRASVNTVNGQCVGFFCYAGGKTLNAMCNAAATVITAMAAAAANVVTQGQGVTGNTAAVSLGTAGFRAAPRIPIATNFDKYFKNLCSSFNYPTSLDVSDLFQVNDLLIEMDIKKQRMIVDFIETNFYT